MKSAKKSVVEACIGLVGVLLIFGAIWLFAVRTADGKSGNVASAGAGNAKPVTAYGETPARGESPSAVVLRSYETLRKGDMASFRTCFTAESMQKISSAAKAGMAKCEGKGVPNIPNVKVVSVLEEGNTAQVKVANISTNGYEPVPIMLRRTAAGWQIDVVANRDNNNPLLPLLRNTMRGWIGLELLEPGRIITDFPKVKLFFAKKQGDWLYDILAFDNSKAGLTREIKAEKARVSTDGGTDIILDMYKVRVSPIDVDKPGVALADRFRLVIPLP